MTTEAALDYVRDFKLSITRALADQLLETLAGTGLALLRYHPEISSLEARPGVYELYVKSDDAPQRVYVGKASKDLPGRLSKHWRKLSGRAGITLEDMYFKCAYVDEDLDASAPEKMLIGRYQRSGEVVWNNNGFGNNDPGRNRDTSVVKQNHFDALYPVDLEHIPVDRTVDFEQGMSVFQLLKSVKGALPFLLRFPDRAKKDSVERKELSTIKVYIEHRDPPSLSADEWLQLAIQSLPSGWQASILPGYVIFYREKIEYDSARWYWRKVDGQAVRITGPRKLGRAGAVDNENDA